MNRESSNLGWVAFSVSIPFVMKKSSLILGFAFGAAALGTANNAHAQTKAPDALDDRYYRDHKDLIKNFNYFGGADSLSKRYNSMTVDSMHVDAQGNFYGSGKIELPGVLLDNRSESDSYIHNGTRYYIRNANPMIETKEAVPGSNIYRLK